jgi:type I restriction-modification system DNA methylase subunit
VSQANMQAYLPYVQQLEDLVSVSLSVTNTSLPDAQIRFALDGQPSQQLRDLINLQDRRETGDFFTSSQLRNQTIGLISETLDSTSVIIDPACGVGDLLIACAQNLPCSQDISATVHTWGNQIRGFDIHPEFIRVAKVRLLLTAIRRGIPRGPVELPPLEEIFPHVKVGNGLGASGEINQASHIVLNPPYGTMQSPSNCNWTSGKVSMAAVFLAECLAHARQDTHLVAILPDVLRTGIMTPRIRTAV